MKILLKVKANVYKKKQYNFLIFLDPRVLYPICVKLFVGTEAGKLAIINSNGKRDFEFLVRILQRFSKVLCFFFLQNTRNRQFFNIKAIRLMQVQQYNSLLQRLVRWLFHLELINASKFGEFSMIYKNPWFFITLFTLLYPYHTFLVWGI